MHKKSKVPHEIIKKIVHHSIKLLFKHKIIYYFKSRFSRVGGYEKHKIFLGAKLLLINLLLLLSLHNETDPNYISFFIFSLMIMNYVKHFVDR